MARFHTVETTMTVLDLGHQLDLELPLPDPMRDRDDWRAVMASRYQRGAELGFDLLDVLRGGLASRYGLRYPGYQTCEQQRGGLQ